MIDRAHWIDKDKLIKFIIDCQVGPKLNELLLSFSLTSWKLGICPLALCCVFNYKANMILKLPLKKLQDRENGGISDRPDDAVDVFHTYFGVAGIEISYTFHLLFLHTPSISGLWWWPCGTGMNFIVLLIYRKCDSFHIYQLTCSFSSLWWWGLIFCFSVS